MKKIFKAIGNGLYFIYACLLIFLAWLATVLCYIPFRIIFPTKVVGKQNLKKCKGGKIVSCNHYSNFDVIFLSVLFFKNILKRKFLAKKELSKNAVIGKSLVSLGAIFINRDALDIKAIKQSVEAINKNKSLIIFPEGTRNKTQDEGIQDLKSGVAFLAGKAKCNIVPIMLLHKVRPFKRNVIIFAEPIEAIGIGKEQIAETIDSLNTVYNKLREEYSNK